ncbi:hypothetical protein [Limosilactobacillus pontis]|uniref:hypothetical protein n=1 Tax=Limosilactobacillus pontis TaxID=35787 RepID=UPI002F263B1A
MESIASVLSLGFLIAVIIAIVFGVKWFKARKDKSGDNYKKNKKRTIITLVVMVVCLVGGSLAQNEADAEEQAAIEARDKKNYKGEKEKFVTMYSILGPTVEDLSKKEIDEWGNAIDNSDDDFDVDATIDGIEKKHSEDIDSVEKEIETLHKADQKIQDNSYASEKDKKTVHSAYLNLKHFANHATDISGSYNDFSDEHNDMDQKTADSMEELQDL